MSMKASKTSAADLFAFQLKAAGITFEREHKFHPDRRWRFDFALHPPNPYHYKLAVEIDGGLFTNGGHTRGRARIGDMTKDVEAMLLGWRVLRVPTDWIKNGIALDYVERLIK